MKIGAIAERLGTTVRTLRYYEEQGLLHPRRSPGGTRQYDAEDEARFAALLALTRLGFSLERLAQLAGIRSASQTGDAASREVAALLRAMDAELDAQARAIAEQRADIERAQAFLQGCHGCSRAPVRSECDHCQISAARQASAVMRVVWDERPVA
ncbi:MerR family transcriptional regulator [Thiorhodococcus minor]|nr:MerR family transcriptional regulator [Thiorhodococcus minor]